MGHKEIVKRAKELLNPKPKTHMSIEDVYKSLQTLSTIMAKTREGQALDTARAVWAQRTLEIIIHND